MSGSLFHVFCMCSYIHGFFKHYVNSKGGTGGFSFYLFFPTSGEGVGHENSNVSITKRRNCDLQTKRKTSSFG